MTSKTSITYGGALYDLAKDEGLSAQILADLGAFAAVFRENPDYRRLLTEPSIPKAEREALLDEAWKDALHPYTLNFVKLLCANGTVSQLPDCETVYRARYNEDNNILAVTAVSAAPMREELQEKLRQKLEAKTGKHVELTVKVEPDLIGGVKLTIGGVQYDGTVRHHLDELQRIQRSRINRKLVNEWNSDRKKFQKSSAVRSSIMKQKSTSPKPARSF